MDNKKINKIAKQLVASFDNEEENQEIDMEQVNREFFEKNVKTQNFNGFTKVFDEQNDALSYVYNNDETQSSYIIFWEDEGMWNYAVYINDDEDFSLEKDTCEQAFNDLVLKMPSYIDKFQDVLAERAAEMQQEEETLGEFSIKKANKANAEKLFRDYDYIENAEYYIAVFYPYGNDRIAVQENLNKIADEMILNTSKKYIMSKNYIVFQILNHSDLNYASSTIESYGWVKK